MTYTRRQFLKSSGAAATAVMGFPSVVRASLGRQRKVVVLAIDGMDPALTRQYMQQGWMPHAKRMVSRGTFTTIATSNPPQSPVAWSNFICGSNPGAHGIFDFIARDPETIQPFLSTTRTTPPTRSLRVGKFSIPLAGGKVELLRKGPAVWDILQEHDVESTAFRAPVNYPPHESSARTIPGITTPDLLGSYGIFSFFTTSRRERSRDVAGGRIERVKREGHRVEAALAGPPNSLVREPTPMTIPFTLDINREASRARLRIQEHTLLLRPGEWSDWCPLVFSMIPHLASLSGICRFYLKALQPHVELYVTPININPADPATPISHPERYSRQLVDDVGYYYTQGMPEDTAALSAGVFSDEEYRRQATDVLAERMRFFDYEFNRFRKGFFYFYFSSLDLDSHMFWRTVDKGHPQYTEQLAAEHGDFLPWLYRQMDGVIGKVLAEADEHTDVYVVSDHGFQSFRRQFNLNSWLMDHGYAKPLNPFDREYSSMFQNTDWSQTRAYGLGINSLYLNRKGREPDGIVSPVEAEPLRDELIAALTALRDPATGERVVAHVYKPEDIYSGPFVHLAPDLIVCYNRNYRASWDTILGKYPREVLLDNMDPWSGDHCMDAQFLAGTLLCNRRLARTDPALRDMAPTLLRSFGVPVPASMTGRSILGSAG